MSTSTYKRLIALTGIPCVALILILLFVTGEVIFSFFFRLLALYDTQDFDKDRLFTIAGILMVSYIITGIIKYMATNYSAL